MMKNKVIKNYQIFTDGYHNADGTENQLFLGKIKNGGFYWYNDKRYINFEDHRVSEGDTVILHCEFKSCFWSLIYNVSKKEWYI